MTKRGTFCRFRTVCRIRHNCNQPCHSSDMCFGTHVDSYFDQSGSDYIDKFRAVFVFVYIENEAGADQLSGVHASWNGGSSCVFRIFRGNRQAYGADRRVSYRIYFSDFGSRIFYRMLAGQKNHLCSRYDSRNSSLLSVLAQYGFADS